MRPALIALLLLPIAAQAQPTGDREVPIAEAYRLHGLPTADALAAQGYDGVRVFSRDGFGRPQPSVAILRKGSKAAEISVSVKPFDQMPRYISGEAADWDWRIAQLLMAEAKAAPVEQPEPTVPNASDETAPTGHEDEEVSFLVCTDSSTALIEVIEAGAVTRRVRSSCGEDLIYDAASALSALAATRIEGCSALDLTAAWPAQILEHCANLSGEDRWSAAYLYNLVTQPAFLAPKEAAPGALQKLLAPTAQLIRPVRPKMMGAHPVAAWFASEVQTRGEFGFQAEDVSVSGSEARVVGGLFHFPDVDADSYFWAPSEQVWRDDVDSGWRLVRWTVGPYEERSF